MRRSPLAVHPLPSTFRCLKVTDVTSDQRILMKGHSAGCTSPKLSLSTVPLAHPSPHTKRHRDQSSHFIGIMVVTYRQMQTTIHLWQYAASFYSVHTMWPNYIAVAKKITLCFKKRLPHFFYIEGNIAILFISIVNNPVCHHLGVMLAT